VAAYCNAEVPDVMRNENGTMACGLTEWRSVRFKSICFK